MRLPSAPNTVPSTQFSCAPILLSSFPLAVSTMRTVLSVQPAATRVPSGESETPNTVSPVSISERRSLPAGDVP